MGHGCLVLVSIEVALFSVLQFNLSQSLVHGICCGVSVGNSLGDVFARCLTARVTCLCLAAMVEWIMHVIKNSLFSGAISLEIL